ncbi:MAG: O-antigen ligase family protein [Acidimicrobiales bacterium]|nr:O-antigen ligase family protein [Acidimicrobiales bacterium]
MGEVLGAPDPRDHIRTIGVIALGAGLVVFQLRAVLDHVIGPPSALTPLVLPLAALCAAVLVIGDRGQLPLGVVPVVVLAATFLPGVALASLEGYSAQKSAELVFVTFGLCLAAVVLVDSTDQVARLNRTLLVLTGLVCTLALVLPGARDVLDHRAWAFDLNPLLMGRAASLLTVLAVLAMLRTSWLNRAGLAALAGIGAYWVIATATRAPGLGLVVGLLAIGAIWWSVERRPGGLQQLWWWAIGVVGSVGIAVALAPSDAVERMTRMRLDDARRSYYEATMDSITSEPFGVGLGDFVSILEPGARFQSRYPHNLLLETGAEAGIIALAAVLALLGAAAMFAWQARATWGRLLLPPFCVVLASAMFSSDLNGNRAVFIFATVSVALGLRDRAGGRATFDLFRPLHRSTPP